MNIQKTQTRKQIKKVINFEKITLIQKEIELVDFEFVVNPNEPDNTLAGCPCLYINGVPHVVYPVDTLKVIKAIETSNTISAVKNYVKGSWCEHTIYETCTDLELEFGLIKPEEAAVKE